MEFYSYFPLLVTLYLGIGYFGYLVESSSSLEDQNLIKDSDDPFLKSVFDLPHLSDRRLLSMLEKHHPKSIRSEEEVVHQILLTVYGHNADENISTLWNYILRQWNCQASSALSDEEIFNQYQEARQKFINQGDHNWEELRNTPLQDRSVTPNDWTDRFRWGKLCEQLSKKKINTGKKPYCKPKIYKFRRRMSLKILIQRTLQLRDLLFCYCQSPERGFTSVKNNTESFYVTQYNKEEYFIFMPAYKRSHDLVLIGLRKFIE